MAATPYTPVVKEGHAFKEISQDFSKPAEIFREAIANALDAYAKRIWLRVHVVNVKGREKVIIDLSDDGIGMSTQTINSFLNLSDSSKPATPPQGMVKRRMTGYKGHGTKVFYNSDCVEILTSQANQPAVYCLIDDPMGSLSEGKPPEAQISSIEPGELVEKRAEWGFADLGAAKGTSIRISGYHGNTKKGLEHLLLVDYIRWFTRWGSWEPKLRKLTETESDEVNDFSQCSLFLRGLGKPKEPDLDEKITFGHTFPTEDCTDVRKLRTKDESDPLKFYVRTWAFAGEALQGNPDKTIDFL